jgi:hypothetical protein
MLQTVPNRIKNMDRRDIASPSNSLQENFAAQEHAGPYAITMGQLFLLLITLEKAATTTFLLIFVVMDFNIFINIIITI